MNFNANCTCRGVPASRMWLNVGELMSQSGKKKFVRFRMLNSSARNWSCFDSVTLKFLRVAKSQLAYAGPTFTLRPSVPNCPALTVGSSRCKAPAFSHALTVRGPLLGLPTRLGRWAEKPVISGALPCAATSFESKTVKGVPLINVAMPFSCHAPNTDWYQLCGWFQNGRSHT